MASICRLSFEFPICNCIGERRLMSTFSRRLYSSKPITVATSTAPLVRRSANYQPSLWSYEYIQSLTSKSAGKSDTTRKQVLIEDVKTMIHKYITSADSLRTLELVDDLQRLGISYHFADEISKVLEIIYYDYYETSDKWNRLDFKHLALGFRLLRKHGYHISQEIFYGILDDNGNIKANLYKDMFGILNLYEASYLSVEDENILDEARDLTGKYLKEKLEKNIIVDREMLLLVTHALELPLHWRVPRVEARWFIEVYNKRSDINILLLQLSVLDFNMVQAIHQEDLKDSSRWWRSTCLEKFSFARDRLMENFLWSIGTNYMPHFRGRKVLTMVNALITTIDDVYDVYGTLYELQQFTDIVSRWDVNVINSLPDYLKIFFMALHKLVNDSAYQTMTNKESLILIYLKKAWKRLFKSYLTEAKWFHSRYIPTFNEYMKNSHISISAHVILMHAYLFVSNSITEEALQCIEKAEGIVHCSAMILRLYNDLSTSSDELRRGDVPKAIQCYMHENDTTEEEAREYIKILINEMWKKLNNECEAIDTPFPRELNEFATNLVRMGEFMYGNGDGHGCPNVIKSHVFSLLINPI